MSPAAILAWIAWRASIGCIPPPENRFTNDAECSHVARKGQTATPSDGDGFKTHAELVGRRLEIEPLKADHVTVSVLHKNDLVARFLANVLLLGIVEPDRKRFAFRVVVDLYVGHTT